MAEERDRRLRRELLGDGYDVVCQRVWVERTIAWRWDVTASIGKHHMMTCSREPRGEGGEALGQIWKAMQPDKRGR